MRQVLHMLSATVFLLLGSASKPINLSEKLLSFREFHRRIWAGGVNLADYDLQIVNGMGATATKLLRDKLKSVASTH
jgi:hypothetical protein